MITTGIARSMQLASTPSITSVKRPVGSRLPVIAPIASRNVSLTGAAGSGTPSMRVSPSYCTRPPGVWTTASTSVRVLTLKMRTSVPDPVRRPVPRRWRRVRRRTACFRSSDSCRHAPRGPSPGRTGSRRPRRAARGLPIATLLVSDLPPPRPSSCNASGEPMMRISTASRRSGVRRQIGGQQKRSARSATAHQHAGNPSCHPFALLRVFDPTGRAGEDAPMAAGLNVNCKFPSLDALIACEETPYNSA